MTKALLVIDMQNICVGKSSAPFFQYDKENLLTNFLNRHFAPFKAFDDTPATELADGLKVVSDHILKKYKGDALSNPDLLRLLSDNNITEIELVGVDGGGCVALTALGALKNGFKIILNTAAIGTGRCRQMRCLFLSWRRPHFCKRRNRTERESWLDDCGKRLLLSYFGR